MAYFLVKWLEPKKDKGCISHVLRSEIDSNDHIEVGMTVKAKYIRRYYKAEIIEVCEEEESDGEENESEGVVEEQKEEGKATVDEVNDVEDAEEEEFEQKEAEKEAGKATDVVNDVGDVVEEEVEEQNIMGEEEAEIEEYEVQPKRRRVDDFNIFDFSDSELTFSDGLCSHSSPKPDNTMKHLLEGLTSLLERSSTVQHRESAIKENATIQALLQRVDALEREVRMLKSCSRPPASSLMSNTSTHPLPPDDDGVYLLGGVVPVSNRAYRKCRSGTNKASSLSRSLLELLFTNEELVNCTLSGTRSNKTDRQPLSPKRMDAIFEEVDLVFPGSRISEERSIREAINGKCRYLRFTKKRDT
ncbi:uncharacterized protein LOC117115333 [Anneissia japonica]|uniref:uncharacterized protein LOC117115333 n=1 Tax=Anneissia japonica TaxID=1529436 RepID=UPI001425A38C|nr:uncharacterized protein LOC117115333 [Anneissia japonica]